MHAAQLRAAVCKPPPSKPPPPLQSIALRCTARQSGARVGSARRTRPRWRWRWELPSRRSGACKQGHGSGQYVGMQGHGQGMRVRFGTPWNGCARRVEDTCGGRACRAGRSAHSADRPVDTGKGGLSTEREQGRVRSDSTPGQAIGHACRWRFDARLLARFAPLSHLSIAGGVPRERSLT
jgi:hypothetical protein